MFRGLLLAAPLLTGCFSYRATAINDLVPRENVRVVADTGFVVHAQAFAGTSQMQERCRVTYAAGTLDRVSADTLFFIPLRVIRPVEGESTACRNLVRGFAINDAGTGLRVNALRFDRQRAKKSLFWGTVVGAFLYWFISDMFTEEVYDFVP